MYRFSYAEILEDAPSECRQHERMAFDRAIELLKVASGTGAKSPEGSEAISFVQRLWNILIDDLLSSENGLPDALKAELISIGLWIMKEADLISQGRSENFSALIDINIMIRDGLK
ncbi:flagellar biosynthesis regulator FlaF [Microvirga sp. GCM10011540]|uniref:flagellar biosynthesis regulator FlaF n=1 Tax=Microvirga sp. GCM10011540 TaxID=3317338 RepID=UPI00361A67FF